MTPDRSFAPADDLERPPRDSAALEPLPLAPPPSPRPGFVGAVGYLYPVARALVEKWRAERLIFRRIVEDQRALDAVLGQLGRMAREAARDGAAQAELTALADEMRRLDKTESLREQAGSEARALITRRASEAERFDEVERRVRAALTRVERTGEHAAAPPAEPLAPLPSEDRSERRRRRKESQKELAQAIAERKRALSALDGELERWQAMGREAASEAARRLVTMGTLINLHRFAHPRMDPLYARIDVLKRRIAERENTIAGLDERLAYDHAAVHKGLMVLAALGGVAILAALVLTLALATTN